MRDPYESLAVPRTATADDIKKSYRLLAKRLHPDANGSDPRAARRFAEVNAAHEILGDAVKRRAFDRGDIDAEGKPRRRTAVTRFRNPGMHIAASVAIVVLTLMFTSTLVIGRLTSLGKITANSGAQAERVTRQDDTYAGKATSLTPTGQDTRLASEPQPDQRQTGLLIARSWKLMSDGNVEAARALLERAVKSHDPRAALALGATYDPLMLAILEARGVEPDAFLARIWYRRAITFGSEEAKKTPASPGRPPRQQGAHILRWDTTPRRPFNVM
jgi:curved DNA-binding protein CbpA